MARWILLVTAAALVLLGRPMDRLATARSDDDQAGCSESDELALRSGRRTTRAIRLGDAKTDEGGSWCTDLGPGYDSVVLVALERDFVFAVVSRHAPRVEPPPALSARGPPSSRA